MELEGKHALVTGANSGLGKAVARALAERGATLYLGARDRDRGEAAVAELRAATGNPNLHLLVADLKSQAAVRRLAAEVAARCEALHLLVNNAGLGSYGALADQDEERIRSLLAVNVTALVELTRAALPGLLAREAGGIINVGSTAGYVPGPYSAVYGATKAFVRSFTEAVSEELRGSPVHVLLLAPGVTETEFQEVAGVPDGVFPSSLAGTSEEVAAAGLAAFSARRPVCVPAPADRIMAYGAQVVPSAITRRLRASVMRRVVS